MTQGQEDAVKNKTNWNRMFPANSDFLERKIKICQYSNVLILIKRWSQTLQLEIKLQDNARNFMLM